MYSRSRSPRALEDSSRLRKLRPFQGVLLPGGVGVQEPGASSHPSLGRCFFSALLLSVALLTSLAWAGGTREKRAGGPGRTFSGQAAGGFRDSGAGAQPPPVKGLSCPRASVPIMLMAHKQPLRKRAWWWGRGGSGTGTPRARQQAAAGCRSRRRDNRPCPPPGTRGSSPRV